MRPSDVDHFAEWTRDEVFCRHAGWRSGLDPAEGRDFWAQLIAEPPSGLLRLTAVAEPDIVGYVDLHGEDLDERELGYVVGPSARWGAGFGSALAAAGVAYAFESLGLDAVWAEALAANEPSVRILRALGMRETGVGDADTFLGEPTHYVRFRLQRSEWAPPGLR